MSSTQELLEASLQLNLRLTSSLGILYPREERHQMHRDVIAFVCKAAEASGISNNQLIELVGEVTKGPYEPITDGLLHEQGGA